MVNDEGEIKNPIHVKKHQSSVFPGTSFLFPRRAEAKFFDVTFTVRDEFYKENTYRFPIPTEVSSKACVHNQVYSSDFFADSNFHYHVV